MSPSGNEAPRLELWGGVECTVNRVGDRWCDQLKWSGHDRRVDDLSQFAGLGIRVLRYPLLWERLAPRTLDDMDWRWADERMARLQELGIRPIVGLVHHGSGPKYTSLLDEGFATGLARFARAVARRYPWVIDFTPINEPLTTARFSGLYGHWYPHHRCNRSYVRALLNQLKGVVAAMRAIRDVTPSARLIQTEDCGQTSGTESLRSQVHHEQDRRWLTWDILTGRLDDRHPLHRFLVDAGMTSKDEATFIDAPCKPDIVGLNYYLTSDRYLDDRLDQYPGETHGGNGDVEYADVAAVRGRPAGIAGHEAHLMAAWERYQIPTALTEVHLACTREEQLRWFAEGWQGALAARARGANVRAVTAWALLGAYDWNSLVTRADGFYEPGVFDVRGPAPRPTALARLIFDLSAATDRPPHPVLRQHGWWRRPERVRPLTALHTTRSGSQTAPLILILGSSGTLGRAFHWTCTIRGLESRLVDRRACDVTDAQSVSALLDRFEPWAVVNATGYVRVDDAEDDVDTCRRVNVMGAVNLAAACRSAEIPLVVFSSDLVFDGQASRPYVEDDSPNPLSVYGRTKAEADRLVLALSPEALVIRTSAFFGPSDQHNFAARLCRTLANGNPFLAPADTTVSPTYVPHLVDATLDLLVDGERGLWHLANAGETSWYAFARTLAERNGLAVDLIVPVEAKQIWGPAVRPIYSALGTRRGQLLPPLEQAFADYARDSREAATRMEQYPWGQELLS